MVRHCKKVESAYIRSAMNAYKKLLVKQIIKCSYAMQCHVMMLGHNVMSCYAMQFYVMICHKGLVTFSFSSQK